MGIDVMVNIVGDNQASWWAIIAWPSFCCVVFFCARRSTKTDAKIIVFRVAHRACIILSDLYHQTMVQATKNVVQANSGETSIVMISTLGVEKFKKNSASMVT